MRTDEKPYYRVVLKSTYEVRTDKTRHQDQARNFQESLSGHTVLFEDKLLRLQRKETWGGNYGIEKGQRNYSYWIPYTSILYIEYVERVEPDDKPDNVHKEKIKT